MTDTDEHRQNRQIETEAGYQQKARTDMAGRISERENRHGKQDIR